MLILSETTHKRGIYLLPNLLTSLSLFSAFYAIVAAMKYDYEVAVIAIFVGMIADLLDGRIARLTNTQSEFGAQFDSLSDMVTFGVAPALVLYSWSLHAIGKIGWLISFMYTAAVALRLARFNVQHETSDIRYFIGMPCPPGAGVVCSLMWFFLSCGITDGQQLAPWLALVMFLIASLMVSNIAFYSFKDLDFKGRVPFISIIVILLAFVAVAAYPALVLMLSFTIYGASGPVYTLLRKRKAYLLRKSNKE